MTWSVVYAGIYLYFSGAGAVLVIDFQEKLHL